MLCGRQAVLQRMQFKKGRRRGWPSLLKCVHHKVVTYVMSKKTVEVNVCVTSRVMLHDTFFHVKIFGGKCVHHKYVMSKKMSV